MEPMCLHLSGKIIIFSFKLFLFLLFLTYYVHGLQMCIFFAADTSVEENKRKETIAALARLEKSLKNFKQMNFQKSGCMSNEDRWKIDSDREILR